MNARSWPRRPIAIVLVLLAACGDSGDSGMKCGDGTHADGGECVIDATDTDTGASDTDTGTADTDTGTVDSDTDSGTAETDSDGETAADDADGDGYSADDCDDTDPAVHPGASDACGDGVDQDCDGVSPACRVSGEYDVGALPIALLGEATGDAAGFQVQAGGDFDGDGVGDLVVTAITASSSRGAAYIVTGPVVTGHLADARQIVDGDQPGGRLAYATWAGDVDGDGADDLLLGARTYTDGGEGGAAFLLMGGTSGREDVATAAAVEWDSPSTGSYRGMQLAGGGDVTGDGVPDVVLADPWDATVAATGGGIYVYTAPFDSSGDPSSAAARLYGSASDQLGWALAGPVDYDGDGIDDVAAVEKGRLNSSGLRGAVVVYAGPLSGSDTAPIPDTVWESSGLQTDEALYAVGDVNGDGLDDLDLCQSGTTGCAILPGGTTGTTNLALAAATIVGTGASDDLEYGGAAGDLDGDGHADVLVGNPADRVNGGQSGANHLFYGPLAGSLTTDDADAAFFAPATAFYTGYGMSGGDVTGDGLPDLLFGATGAEGDAASSGVAYVLPGL